MKKTKKMLLLMVVLMLSLTLVVCANDEVAPSMYCVEGDVDYDNDGVRNQTNECWPNGNKKKIITYQSDGLTKISEGTFREDGTRQNSIFYQSDGIGKDYEYTYREDDSIQNRIEYQSDGVGKDYEYRYREDDSIQNRIEYQSDGVTKEGESTYREDGTKQNTIGYQSDGVTKDSEYKFYENKFLGLYVVKLHTNYEMDGTTISNYTCHATTIPISRTQTYPVFYYGGVEECSLIKHGIE